MNNFQQMKAQATITDATLRAENERLRAENERLRTALEPFSKASDGFDTMPVKNPEEWFAYGGVKPAGQDAQGAITVGDLRRARAALGGDNGLR